MKIAVIGSRTIKDYCLVEQELKKIISQDDEIISGGASGVDEIAEMFAKKNKIKLTIFKAEWSKYGKKAGYIRNKEIWKYCDWGIAFWDGKSKGTQHSFKLAKELNKKIIIKEIK